MWSRLSEWVFTQERPTLERTDLVQLSCARPPPLLVVSFEEGLFFAVSNLAFAVQHAVLG